jgi:hypothetical protein
VIAATSLLLPLAVGAESQVQTGTPSGKVFAAARVDFRIVIPTVLSLGVAGGEGQEAGMQTVAIFSNSRNVALTASSGSKPAVANVILRAAARKVIAREAACRLPAEASRSPGSQTMICTVSMP